MADRLANLSDNGVSIWLDDLSRSRLTTGSLAGLVAHDHVVGVTTNPAIFAKAIAGSDAYANQMRDLWARGAVVGEALRGMTAFDVRWACDVLRPVYDRTSGVDGRVSIEVDPRGWPTTPRPPSPRHGSCGGWSTGPTCWSRSRPPGRGCRPSPRAWPKGSASTSR
jgi:transaldolase